MTGGPFSMPYPILVRPDICTDGSFCYVAEHPDLPGCAAHGQTIEEARQHLAQAREAYISHIRALGEPLPPPHAVPMELLWSTNAIRGEWLADLWETDEGGGATVDQAATAA